MYQIIIRVSDQPKPDIKHLFLLTAERVMEYKNLPLYEQERLKREIL